MNFQQSHLRPDGTVFPPVTPDRPPTPGQEAVLLPELLVTPDDTPRAAGRPEVAEAAEVADADAGRGREDGAPTGSSDAG